MLFASAPNMCSKSYAWGEAAADDGCFAGCTAGAGGFAMEGRGEHAVGDTAGWGEQDLPAAVEGEDLSKVT